MSALPGHRRRVPGGRIIALRHRRKRPAHAQGSGPNAQLRPLFARPPYHQRQDPSGPTERLSHNTSSICEKASREAAKPQREKPGKRSVRPRIASLPLRILCVLLCVFAPLRETSLLSYPYSWKPDQLPVALNELPSRRPLNDQVPETVLPLNAPVTVPVPLPVWLPALPVPPPDAVPPVNGLPPVTEPATAGKTRPPVIVPEPSTVPVMIAVLSRWLRCGNASS